jgi:hypothetical protein
MFFMFQKSRTVSGPDPETASAIVSGAGSASSNGTYERNGDVNGRPNYELLGGNFIRWSGASWVLNDNTVGGTTYSSSDDVAYPWLVTTWVVEDGTEPVPTVTIG